MLERIKKSNPDKSSQKNVLLGETGLSVQMQDMHRNKRRARTLLLPAVFLAGALSLLLLQKPAIEKKLQQWKLIPTEEPFTELFFENPTGLPKTISAGEIAHFSFTVKNREDADENYRYIVYVKNGSDKQTVEQGSIFLKNEESKTIQVSYTVPQDYSKATFFVELPEENQMIHFLTANKR